MKVWRTAPDPGPGAERLASASGLPLPAARILHARGIRTAEEAERFLRPRLSDLSDPFDLPDMEPAIDRIGHALRERERIAVFGDYDVDGITAAALCVETLRALGGDAQPFLPHRERDGYGLQSASMGRCLDLLRPALLLTVDCGTGSVEAVRRAAERGVDVIVTDHHEIPGRLAPACAVVNPKRGDPETPWSGLCGAGVAFKLCHALLRRERETGRQAAAGPDLRESLDLVALGTVADVAPLTGENRTLVRHGLDRLSAAARPGLRALLQVSGVTGTVDTDSVGFILAPRLNAAGRLGAAQQAIDLLLTDDPRDGERIARDLDAANRERQRIENDVLKEAEREAAERFEPGRDFVIVASGTGWHPGVIGIVASRLAARFHRPAAVITARNDGPARGSCRGIAGFNLVEALAECAPALLRFGGHAGAAGIELDPGQIPAFRNAFQEAVAARLRGADLSETLHIDAWLDPADVDEPLLEAIEAMRPFGEGHRAPVWAVSGLTAAGPPRVVGQRHLKLTLACGGRTREAIGFRMAGAPVPDGPMDAAFALSRNEWRGRRTLQLVLEDLRPSPRSPNPEPEKGAAEWRDQTIPMPSA